MRRAFSFDTLPHLPLYFQIVKGEEMGDTASIHGNRPREAPGNSLASAQAFLEGGLPANADSATDEWEARFGNETEKLHRWAAREGCLIDGSLYADRITPGGMEHDLWFNEPSQRWFKITHPGEFGRFPEVVDRLDKRTQRWTPEVLLRIATPKEYLERIRLQNELFGDDIRLEGVSIRDKKLSAIISQPHIVGRAPRLDEIASFMTKAGFSAGPNFSFLDSTRKIAALDAQPKNFVRTRGGQVIPIDLILASANECLVKVLV